MDTDIIPTVSVLEVKLRWIALPPQIGAGVRSMLHTDDVDIVVEKAFGVYYFTATNVSGKVVFDSRRFTDSRRLGWMVPGDARRAAERWASGQ